MVAAATRLGTLAGAVPESRRGTTPRRARESSTTDTTSTFRRTKLAEVLAGAVQEDGSFLNPPSVCGIGVSPGYPGVTRGRGRFGLDADGSLVGGVHNSNPGQTTCVNGATIPVMTRKPPFKVPRFAIGPLRAWKIVLRTTNNSGALKKMNKKKQTMALSRVTRIVWPRGPPSTLVLVVVVSALFLISIV